MNVNVYQHNFTRVARLGKQARIEISMMIQRYLTRYGIKP